MAENNQVVEQSENAELAAETTEQQEKLIPAKFALSDNFPNPFNPSTTMEIAVPKAGLVTASIYNILGQRVFTHTKEYRPGYHRFTWDGVTAGGHHAPSGIYFLNAAYQDKSELKKMVLIR